MLFCDKKKAKNYHNSEWRSSITRRSCVAIAACNKQLPARLVTSIIIRRQHLVARLH